MVDHKLVRLFQFGSTGAQHYQRETVEVIGKISKKEVSQHCRCKISGATGALIVSVFLLLSYYIIHILHEKYITMESSKTLLIYFMLNTLNNDNNITRTLEIIKYPVPHYF